MANFSSIYTAGARSSFTLELHCSTEGRSGAGAEALLVHGAPTCVKHCLPSFALSVFQAQTE